MDLEIVEENKAPIEIFSEIPAALQQHFIPSTVPLIAKGQNFIILMLQFQGDGFAAWYTRYFMHEQTVLSARGGMPVLELRISLKNRIKGVWEKVKDAELPVHCFQMAFVPYVATKAIFESPGQYETFDIHFDISFLMAIGIDYKTLDKFLNAVTKNKPAELSNKIHHCPTFMLDAIRNILRNPYSAEGKRHTIKNNISNILIAALEEVGREEISKMPLSPNDTEALFHVKKMIEDACPEYPGNDVLVAKAQPGINLFKLGYGFKILFGINPYDYYLERRFNLAKKLLKQGHKVESVSDLLGYEFVQSFQKEFKRRFGYTPGQYQKYGD
jgi:hypothetical protein